MCETQGITQQLLTLQSLKLGCLVQGRKKNTDSGGTSVGSVAGAVAAAAKSRKSPKQLLDFYRFQARDRRRDSTSLTVEALLLFCKGT